MEAAIAEHATATLTTRELIQLHESLARYGVGVQQEVEKKDTQLRYVVRMPMRDATPTGRAEAARVLARAREAAAGPVAVVPAPIGAGDEATRE